MTRASESRIGEATAALAVVTSMLFVAGSVVAADDPASSEGEAGERTAGDATDRSPSERGRETEDWRVDVPQGTPTPVRRAVETVRRSAADVAAGAGSEGASGRVNRKETDGDDASDSESPSVSEESEASGSSASGSSASAEEPRFRSLRRTGEADGDDRFDGSMPEQGRRGEAGWYDSAESLLRESSERRLDLSPYVESSKWRRAMELLVEDDCREALDLADEVLEERGGDWESVPALRYAVARIKMCGPQRREGESTMRALTRLDGPIAEMARRRLGGDPVPIRRENAGEGFADRLRTLREEVADAPVDTIRRAFADIRSRASESWQEYQAYETEAKLLQAKGHPEAAARTFLGAYRMARDWSVGDELTNRIERLEQRHGLDVLSMGDRVDRMRELIAQGDYRKAKRVSIENAEIAGVSGRRIEGWSYYRRALQAERQKRRTEAMRLFERAEARVESPAIRPRLYYGWARAVRRASDNERAIELYDRLCREYATHHLCDDARYQAGRLHQYMNQHERARAYFADLVGLHPDSSYRHEALWRGAFSAYLAGDYEAARAPLAELLEVTEETDASDLPVALKARYWRGVVAYKQGNIGEAKRRFQATINRAPWSWYGRLAATRLRRLGERPVVPRPPRALSRLEVENPQSVGVPADPRLQVSAEYARLGLYEDAVDELERQVQAGGLPEGARDLLATFQLKADQPAEAHWMMEHHLEGETPTVWDLRSWGLAYPPEYLEHAHEFGAEFDVSPFLVQGVMRQESGFRASVSSWVGAVGLMQLMPGTANSVSDDLLDGAYLSRSKLRKPATNVKVGTVYMRMLTEWVDGQVPMALAGYNAGPGPVRKWFDRYGDRELDAWVESITYEQARGYVRDVYTSYVRYAALYGGRLPRLRLELPDRLAPFEHIPQALREGGSAPISRGLGGSRGPDDRLHWAQR